MNKRNTEIIARLAEMFPNAKPELVFSNNLELLIAVILSAQCTDKRVNAVTAQLFKECKSAKDYVALGEVELGKRIYSCGFYAAKAKHIVETCRILLEQYNGEVPSDPEQLRALPGVGRKTANVVYSVGFGGDAIAVDTHVFRVSNRLGLTDADNVLETEKQLMRALDKKIWSKAHHYLIFLGRYICHSRSPQCGECGLRELCKYYAAAKGDGAKTK